MPAKHPAPPTMLLMQKPSNYHIYVLVHTHSTHACLCLVAREARTHERDKLHDTMMCFVPGLRRAGGVEGRGKGDENVRAAKLLLAAAAVGCC